MVFAVLAELAWKWAARASKTASARKVLPESVLDVEYYRRAVSRSRGCDLGASAVRRVPCRERPDAAALWPPRSVNDLPPQRTRTPEKTPVWNLLRNA